MTAVNAAVEAKSTPFVPAKRHLQADALIALAGLLARDRVEESAGYWQVAATDENVVADIVAGLDHLVESVDPDTGGPVWSGFLLGQVCYVRLRADEPTLAQVAAAALTPDAEVAP